VAINEALAEYLALYHKGEANAVTSRELECSFQMRGSELRREINALRGDGIPICSFEGGYYYAATAEYHPAAPQPHQENRICRAWSVQRFAGLCRHRSAFSPAGWG
jgi:biotin operon repressor